MNKFAWILNIGLSWIQNQVERIQSAAVAADWQMLFVFFCIVRKKGVPVHVVVVCFLCWDLISRVAWVVDGSGKKIDQIYSLFRNEIFYSRLGSMIGERRSRDAAATLFLSVSILSFNLQHYRMKYIGNRLSANGWKTKCNFISQIPRVVLICKTPKSPCTYFILFGWCF